MRAQSLSEDVAMAEQVREDARLAHEIRYDTQELAIKQQVANKPVPKPTKAK